MENFTFTLPSASGVASSADPALCGVVSSGNLEVLVELLPSPNSCEIVVSTSAHGYRDIWQAVLGDFAARHPVAGLRLSINDAGATPAVVGLRLDQVFEIYRSRS